jgi:hypothetical protein
LVFAFVCGCSKAPQIKRTPIYPYATVGKFSKKEVEDLHEKLVSLKFPLDYSVRKFLPPGFKDDPGGHFEPPPGPVVDQALLGWDGAMYVEDFWLNEDFILRTGTGIFPADGGPPTTRWAVIIPSSEQETYTRKSYPHPKEPKQLRAAPLIAPSSSISKP